MTRSTKRTRSDVRPGFPWALAVALALALLVELAVARHAPTFMNDQWIQLGEKLRWAESDARADVLVLGDSSTIAGLQPARVEQALGAGTRVLNLGLTGTGPTGAEMLLRRYLANHEPPGLVVLAHSPISLMEARPELFLKYPLTHLLGPGEMLRAARDSRDPHVVLVWVASRLPSYRYRNGLLTGAVSLVLDRSPRLRHRIYALMGISTNALARQRFDWGFAQRAQRNASVLERVRAGAGWYYSSEYALPGERLPAAHTDRHPPFLAVRREVQALRRTLDLAEDAGVRVLVVPAPLPRWLASEILAGGGAERLERLRTRLVGGRSKLYLVSDPVLTMDHRYFADPRHLNPEGAALYTTRITPLVVQAYRGDAP
jgi:hypothetical protein